MSIMLTYPQADIVRERTGRGRRRPLLFLRLSLAQKALDRLVKLLALPSLLLSLTFCLKRVIVSANMTILTSLKPLLRAVIGVALLAAIFISTTSFTEAAVRVRGYTRKDGTYVAPHYRSSPDSNPYNNYSFPGNTNPYTGETATGNASTYLDNYYNSGSSSSSGTSSFSLPSIYTPTFSYTVPSILNIYDSTTGQTVLGTSTDKTSPKPTADSKVPLIVSQEFNKVYGRSPTESESKYWKARMRSDKKTVKELNGAMQYHKDKGVSH